MAVLGTSRYILCPVSVSIKLIQIPDPLLVDSRLGIPTRPLSTHLPPIRAHIPVYPGDMRCGAFNSRRILASALLHRPRTAIYVPDLEAGRAQADYNRRVCVRPASIVPRDALGVHWRLAALFRLVGVDDRVVGGGMGWVDDPCGVVWWRCLDAGYTHG